MAVTAGYIGASARDEFFDGMDAANIDLKAFTEGFYRKQCGGHLAPVLDTIDVPKGAFLGSLPEPGDDITTLSVSHRLVARGASNVQVADELTLSVHTVKKHVAKLLLKLKRLIRQKNCGCTAKRDRM